MANAGELTVKIGADTSELDRGLSSARSQLGAMSSRAAVAAKAIAGVTVALAGVASAVVYFTKQSADASRELRVLAGLSNTSTQTFQKQAFAARTAGVEQQKFADILKDVNDRVGDFITTGGGPMADFFEKIAPQVGVTAEQFRRLSGPEALQLYVSSLEKANLSQGEMVFFMEAMASDASALLPLLRNNGDEMARLAEQAEALGIVLSDVDMAALEDFSNQFERVSAIISGIRNALAVELAPVLAEIADRMTTLAVESGGWGDVIREGVEIAITGMARVADAIHQVRLANAAVERGTAEMNLAFAQFAENAWTAMSGLFDNIIAGINAVIDGFNKIPGIDDIPGLASFGDGEFMDGVRANTDRAMEAAWGAREAYAALAGQDMPSQKIEEFFDAVEQRRQELADSVANDGGFIPGTGGGGVGTAGGGEGAEGEGDEREKSTFSGFMIDDAWLELLRERMEARQEILDEFREIDTERASEMYADRIDRLKEALENELITTEEFYQGAQEAERDHWNKITSTRQQALRNLANMTAHSYGEQAGQAVGALAQIVNATATYSEKAFKIQKAAAIASAIVSTYQGVAKTLATYPWPIAGVLAAAHLATGMAQVQSIRSQSFNGGVSSGGGGGSVSTGGGSAASAEPSQPQGGQGPQGGTLTVQGLDRSALFTGDAVAELAEELLQYQRRGGEVVLV